MLENLGKDVCQCQKVNYTSSAKSRKGSWNRENVLAAMSMMTWDIQQLVAWCPHTTPLSAARNKPTMSLSTWELKNTFLGT